MSEKRFDIAYGGNVITDKDGRDLNLSVKWCVEELVGLLNEQQATISQLKEENEQLRKQCFELEKDYLIETSDISDKIYLEDEIKKLKNEYIKEHSID